ncbi:transcriptional regulator GcvA [uncultured Stenotrophomonas sp.]|uniref:transcriptional regulator GcvA n=1 Tax=uncultured Stenotrophomonas sp. TaxID=165438 RepID=UPI0028EA0AD6|nr:transcriptional regulator GcvA [uncultured Stenotrophomonas sp.]
MRQTLLREAPVKARPSAPLNALRTFEAAARHLSFNAAASELFVTPAAVSHQVKHLEAYLGVSLFQRNHRSVALTPEGAALATSVGELLGQLDRALDRARTRAPTELRVTTMESFAAKWLVPRLHRFHQAFPDVRVRIDTSDERADFHRDGFDVGIRYGPGNYVGVCAEVLMQAPVFPVCSPTLVSDSQHRLQHPDDLRHYTLLHDEGASGRAGVPAWSDWLAAAGARKVNAASGPVFASIYLAQEAAASGHGVALGLAPLVEEDLRQGRLVRPLDQELRNAYAFWLIQRETAQPRADIEAFCQWLRDEQCRPLVAIQ